MKELTTAKRMLWFFGLFKIPLIGYVRPQLLELSEAKMVIKVPLRRRTKNHLGSMYFGALAIGADLAGAFQAFYIAKKSNSKLSIVFKNFEAEFIKRPESDVFFVSEDGMLIEDMISESKKREERITRNITINAYTQYPNNPERIANFVLGLSVKHKQ